jgi:hypothetical protein
MIKIATRFYDIDGLFCVDTLFRRGRSYGLRLTGGGEPDAWQVVSEAAALQWLSEGTADLVVHRGVEAIEAS